MSKETLVIKLLVTLYRSASRGYFPDETALARSLSVPEAVVVDLLASLDRAGYVDRSQLRLTLTGLAVAVAAAKKQKPKTLAHAA